MLEFLKRHFKNEKGLSLVELLAVIVILGIIAAIAIPAIGNIINNSRDRAILAEASNILSGAKIAHTEGACNATAGCTGSVLNDYVEGVDLTDDNATVNLNGTTGEWSITYSRFEDIVREDNSAGITDETATETVLINLLDRNASED